MGWGAERSLERMMGKSVVLDACGIACALLLPRVGRELCKEPRPLTP